MKRLMIVFILCCLGCAGPAGGPVPEIIDRPREITEIKPESRPIPRDPRFRPYLKATTTLHCLLVGGPVDREDAGGAPVHLHYHNPETYQPNLRLVGTDLGRTFLHRGTNIILFGDTWPVPTFAYDDSLATFATPTPDQCPILIFPHEEEPEESMPVRPIMVYHPDPTGEWIPYRMDALKTPMAGFSDGENAYGIFGVGAQICPCDTGDTCTGGLCFSPEGYVRVLPRSIAASPELPAFYEEGLLSLHNFVNISVRVVPHFDPENISASVYHFDPAVNFDEQATKPALFVWGKPGFGHLLTPPPTYLMYYDLSATGDYRWIPHYFTGLIGGVPQWSTVPASEKTAPGITPVITSASETIEGEQIKYPAQISVSFIPALNKWIMLYGGRRPGNKNLNFYFADNTKMGIYLRHADHPWGPWSAPRRIWSATNDGGHTSFMFHKIKNPNAYDYNLAAFTTITDDAPARNDAYDYGAEYGASIIDSMTWHDETEGKTHVYWAMSTWNPYRVVLMHTVLEYEFRPAR